MVDMLGRMKSGLSIRSHVDETKRQNKAEELRLSIHDQMAENPNQNVASLADFRTLSSIDEDSAIKQYTQFSQVGEARQRKYVDTMMKTKNALAMGDKEGAANFLDQQIATVRANGGDSSNSEYVRRLLDQDAKSAYSGLQQMENSLIQQGYLKPDARIENRANRRVQSTRYEDGGSLITYTDGQQEFKPFSKEQIETAKKQRPDMPVGQTMKIMALQDSAHESRNLAATSESLAGKIRASKMPSGVVAKGSEMFKTLFGTEDEISQTRKNYTRIKNEFLVKNLPAGVASDRDIQLIAEGYLQATANRGEMASFLDSLSRVQQDAAMYDDFRATFLELSGGIQQSDRDFVYKGVKLDEGVSLDDAYTKFVSEKFKAKPEEKTAPKQDDVIDWNEW